MANLKAFKDAMNLTFWAASNALQDLHHAEDKLFLKRMATPERHGSIGQVDKLSSKKQKRKLPKKKERKRCQELQNENPAVSITAHVPHLAHAADIETNV